jgi:hypothetical protein
MGQGLETLPARSVSDMIVAWNSPGPVASAFVADLADATFICGPVGSGKSTAADVVKPVLKACQQKPGADGVRHYRLITFRDTQRNAWKSTIPTVKKWIDFDAGEFTGSEDRPCRLLFRMRHPQDGGLIVCEFWWFGMPSSEQELEAALKGVEASDINLAEADQMSRYAFDWATGRVGRHPSGRLGQNMHPQVWGTFNATDHDHWMHDLCVDNPPEGLTFHHQPAGLLSADPPYRANPLTENIKAHGAGDGEYWVRQARLSKPGTIKRALMAQFGAIDGDGLVVYPEFVGKDHIAPVTYHGGDVWLAMDGGGTPPGVLIQRAADGGLEVIDEVILYHPDDPKRMTLRAGVGPTQFAEACQIVCERHDIKRLKGGWSDPAAFYAGDAMHGDLAFADKVGRVLDVQIQPAPVGNNDRVLREEGVRLQLGKRGDGGRAMLRIDPRCRWLLMGLRGRFQYQGVKIDGRIRANKERRVVKNEWSHVCEALEYGGAGLVGGRAALLRGGGTGLVRPGPAAVQRYGSKGVRW